MRFSKLQQQFERFLAPSLQKKVKIYATVHRKAHDQPAKLWMTYNKKEIMRADDLAFLVYVNPKYEAATMYLEKIPFHEQWEIMMQSEERKALLQINQKIEEQAIDEEFYAAWWFYEALLVFYTLPIEQSFDHANPAIQAMAMLDRRIGKRRLASFRPQHPLVQKMYALRCEAEGLCQKQKMDSKKSL